MKLHPRFTALAALTLLAGFVAGQAHAARLSDLIDLNGNLVLGDKQFDDFDYVVNAGEMPDASDVNIDVFFDLNGNVNLRITGAFTDAVGGGASDATLMYTVSVLDPAQSISTVGMNVNAALGGTNGSFNITETFVIAPGGLEVFSGPGGTQLSDSQDFNPTVSQLQVQKDIFINSGDDPNSNQIVVSVINQSFEQVPEPMSIALTLLGTLGAFGLVRRMRPRC
jgi:hypothetical protein